MRTFGTHAALEASRPWWQAHEREIERQRRASHLLRHGTDTSYQPSREFPCPGVLTPVDTSGPMWWIGCSRCRFEMGVRNPHLPPKKAGKTAEEAVSERRGDEPS